MLRISLDCSISLPPFIRCELHSAYQISLSQQRFPILYTWERSIFRPNRLGISYPPHAQGLLLTSFMCRSRLWLVVFCSVLRWNESCLSIFHEEKAVFSVSSFTFTVWHWLVPWFVDGDEIRPPPEATRLELFIREPPVAGC